MFRIFGYCFIVLLVSLIYGCSYEVSQNDVVSVDVLISRPSEYVGESLYVRGYLAKSSSGIRIFPTADYVDFSGRFLLPSTLLIYDGQRLIKDDCLNKYVVVKGSIGIFSGFLAVKELSDVELLEDDEILCVVSRAE